MHLRISAISTLFFIGLPAVSHAQEVDEKVIRTKIAEIDARMYEGEIESSQIGKIMVGGRTPLNNERTHIRFQKPDKVWWQSHGVKTFNFYDGQDIHSVDPRSDTASIDRSKSPYAADSSFLLRIVNGPSFPFGRGLSKLSNLRVSKQGQKLIARGEFGDSFYTATLDSKHDFLAQHIERERKDGIKVRAEFDLTKPIQAPSGEWLASHSVYRVTRENGEIAAEQQFDVHRANFVRPADSYFSYTFPQDLKIWDHRLGRGVFLQKKRDHPMTKDEIVPISQKLAVEQERILAQNAEFERQYYRTRLIKILLITVPLLLGLSLGGYRFIKSRK